MLVIIDIGDSSRSRPSRSLTDLAKFHQVPLGQRPNCGGDPEWGYNVVSHPGDWNLQLYTSDGKPSLR